MVPATLPSQVSKFFPVRPLFVIPLVAIFSAIAATPTISAAEWPKLELREILKEMQEEVAAGLPEAKEEYEELQSDAEAALAQGPLSVIQKNRTPPSGDKRDYLSIAPYWWPDPEAENQLPWIWRDGEINPKTRGNHVDLGRKGQLFKSVKSLAAMAYLTGDAKYGTAADEILHHWFVNPESRMNPHLKYAQGIPGRYEGRRMGIIEWVGLQKVLAAVTLLDEMGHLQAETKSGLKLWLEDFLQWLETSEMGIAEAEAPNNHGTWYDVLHVSLLVYLDRKEKAGEVLETVTKARIQSQIEPDGKQPKELARTRTYSYSLYNLSAFKILASFGQELAVDLKGYETEDGRSISKAAAFMQPYVEKQKEWPYQEISTGLPPKKK